MLMLPNAPSFYTNIWLQSAGLHSSPYRPYLAGLETVETLIHAYILQQFTRIHLATYTWVAGRHALFGKAFVY